MTTAKKEATPKGAKIEEVLKQNEALLKRIEELEKVKEEKPKSYEEQIKFFEMQQQIISHLQRFQNKKIVIEDALKLVKDKTDNGDFEAKVFALTLTSTNGQKQTVFNITNPVVIGKTLESVTAEVNIKIESLKEQLTL
jgi:flagellar biosynthesis/type III secretory pathway chaperone